jgi:AcrR family transcriptional regulator
MIEEDKEEPTLRAVARRTGVSATAAYRHFADKAALLKSASDHGFNDLRQALLLADDDRDFRRGLIEQGLAYVGFALDHPGLFRLMFAGDGLALRQHAQDDSAYAVFAGRLATLTDPARIGPAGLSAWAMVHGLAALLSPDIKRSDAILAAREALTFYIEQIDKKASSHA